MAEISKTNKKGLNLPEHYDPSFDKLKENMTIIDELLQKSVPNDVIDETSISEQEPNINNLLTWILDNVLMNFIFINIIDYKEIISGNHDIKRIAGRLCCPACFNRCGNRSCLNTETDLTRIRTCFSSCRIRTGSSLRCLIHQFRKSD